MRRHAYAYTHIHTRIHTCTKRTLESTQEFGEKTAAENEVIRLIVNILAHVREVQHTNMGRFQMQMKQLDQPKSAEQSLQPKQQTGGANDTKNGANNNNNKNKNSQGKDQVEGQGAAEESQDTPAADAGGGKGSGGLPGTVPINPWGCDGVNPRVLLFARFLGLPNVKDATPVGLEGLNVFLSALVCTCAFMCVYACRVQFVHVNI